MSAAPKRKGDAGRSPVSKTKRRAKNMPAGALELSEQHSPRSSARVKRDFLGRSREDRISGLEQSIQDLADGKAIPFAEGLARIQQAREGGNG